MGIEEWVGSIGNKYSPFDCKILTLPDLHDYSIDLVCTDSIAGRFPKLDLVRVRKIATTRSSAVNLEIKLTFGKSNVSLSIFGDIDAVKLMIGNGSVRNVADRSYRLWIFR